MTFCTRHSVTSRPHHTSPKPYIVSQTFCRRQSVTSRPHDSSPNLHTCHETFCTRHSVTSRIHDSSPKPYIVSHTFCTRHWVTSRLDDSSPNLDTFRRHSVNVTLWRHSHTFPVRKSKRVRDTLNTSLCDVTPKLFQSQRRTFCDGPFMAGNGS